MSDNFLKIKNGIGLKPKNLATIVNPAAGDVACDESDNKIKFYDVSTSTWKEMGSDGGVVSSVNGQTGAVVLTKSDVGLSNVDNTSDANKPISTATQAALDNIKQDLDNYYHQDMEGLANTTDFSTGNNAAFMGGGTLQGTLSLEEVSPISGTKSLKYVQAAGSVDDYFASPIIDLDLKQKNNTSAMTFYFEYDGNDNDGRFVVYDVTNSRELASEVSFVKVANKATRYSISFYVPSDCNQIRWGYKVLVQNTGKILLVDDVELSMNPFQAKDISNITPWSTPVPIVIGATVTAPTKGTTTIDSVRWRQVGEDYEVEYRYSQTTAGTAGSGEYIISLPVGVEIDPNQFSISSTVYANRIGTASIGVDSPTAFPPEFFPYYAQGSTTSFRARGLDSLTIGWSWGSTACAFNRAQGWAINLKFKGKGLSASSSNVLLPSDTFSSDSAPLTFKSTAIVDADPIGTFNTYTYAANTNTATISASSPTQTVASMNVDGFRVFARAYNASSTAASPARVDIKIGKGLKAVQVYAYANLGKTLPINYTTNYSVLTSDFYNSEVKYNETTGILSINAGENANTVTTRMVGLSEGRAAQTSGYFVFNAGRTLPLLAVPTPLVAYLKDVKPSGTAGGTFTAGAWQTRTLNTIEGDSSIVSLSANQFTLAAGKYEIEASAPAYRVLRNKAKLRNITDSVDSIIGTSETSAGSDSVNNHVHSMIAGTISITKATSFEIQHQAQSSYTSTGFGIESSFGVNEIYTQVKITRLQ